MTNGQTDRQGFSRMKRGHGGVIKRTRPAPLLTQWKVGKHRDWHGLFMRFPVDSRSRRLTECLLCMRWGVKNTQGSLPPPFSFLFFSWTPALDLNQESHSWIISQSEPSTEIARCAIKQQTTRCCRISPDLIWPTQQKLPCFPVWAFVHTFHFSHCSQSRLVVEASALYLISPGIYCSFRTALSTNKKKSDIIIKGPN